MIFNFKRWFQRDAPAPQKRTSIFSTDLTAADNSFPFDRSEILRSRFKLPEMRSANGETIAMDDVNGFGIPGLSDQYSDLQAISDAQFLWYATQSFIGWQVCAILSQHWFISKACWMPAKDAVRNGYDIACIDGQEIAPEIFDDIKRMDKKYKVKKNCKELVGKGNIFGIRLAIFKVDGINYELPFNPDGVQPGAYKGIVQIDPYWCVPEFDNKSVRDFSSGKFYEPEWWRVSGMRYHKSHCVVYRTEDLCDINKPAYQYGGIPLPQRLAERVYASERTANEAPMLALTKRLAVLYTDLDAVLANQRAFNTRMQQRQQLRDNFGTEIIGTDDKREQFDTTLTDVDAVIKGQYDIACSIAEVPVTKMMGTSPDGMNATGESDSNNYDGKLEGIQSDDMEPLLDAHYIRLMRSYVLPKHGIQFEAHITWKELDTPTTKEAAETNYIKAQTDALLATAGAIDGTDIRQRIVGDKDSGYMGIAEVVPNGPGDRSHEQEVQEQLLANGQQEMKGEKNEQVNE